MNREGEGIAEERAEDGGSSAGKPSSRSGRESFPALREKSQRYLFGKLGGTARRAPSWAGVLFS